MSLNPLANPKGIKLNCELCQKPAFIQCTKCRVTYYCGVEHQKADWIGIHEKICQLLIPLRTPDPFFSSQEDRQHRQAQILHRQKHMIDLTRTTGQKLLFEGKHEQAIPAAMQSLRFAIQVHGLASIELVPSYLILGEASIGLNSLNQAEEYLSQAQWTVLKTPNVSDAIKSKLFRNIGLLHAAKGEYDEALRQLADDVYHSSLAYNTDDIHTSGGYYHMANIFFKQGQTETANSLFEKLKMSDLLCPSCYEYQQILDISTVLTNQIIQTLKKSSVRDIWYDHLFKIVAQRTAKPKTPKGVILATEEDEEDEDGLDEAQEAEAIQVLNAIYDTCQSEDMPAESIARNAYALAMLYYTIHDIERAKEYGRKAVVASENSNDESFTRSVVDFMKSCDRVPSMVY